MASFGHVAVGLAAARFDRRERPRAGGLFASMAFWSALSLLPDADVIGFRLGVAYAAPWGHRGATHSLAFALGIGLVVGLIAPLRQRGALATGLLASAVVATHSLLDSLTDGGLGCALLWPFADTRYFAPWNSIPVAPIGRALLSAYGLRVALTELFLFAPLVVYAFWPRTQPREHGDP